VRPQGLSLPQSLISSPARAALPQPRRQISQSPHGPDIADGEGAGLRLPDEDDELLAACDTGIEEIATQHGVVLGRQRDDDRGVL